MTYRRKLIIGNHLISDDSDCYIIAEIGHNHQGSLETCKKLFLAAKNGGVNAVKLQKRDNMTLFTREAYRKVYDNPNSYGETYGEHREFLEFGWHEYVELKKYAKELDLDFFSTAFDIPSAEFLEKLDVPAFKFASGDLKTISLLKHVAKFGKPMIMSTGGASMEDIRRAYDAVMPINDQICIMQCTGGYPPEWHELNLMVIDTLRKEFPDIVVGFSSHDSGIAMAVAGYMLGARIIEKHFTLNRAMKGTDHAFRSSRQA
jgi:N-acetylneuraminate synthase/sialic acid synthase